MCIYVAILVSFYDNFYVTITSPNIFNAERRVKIILDIGRQDFLIKSAHESNSTKPEMIAKSGHWGRYISNLKLTAII